MLYFMKPLPKSKIDTTDWSPFIRSQWLRNNFMYVVDFLAVVLVIISFKLGVHNLLNLFTNLGLCILTFVIHELLHAICIYKNGDISITFSHGHLWIVSGAVLSKLQYLVVVTLPLIILTILPAILCIFLSGKLKDIAVYVAWMNAIIADSDILKSVLIAIKPKNSVFYQGYYKVKS